MSKKKPKDQHKPNGRPPIPFEQEYIALLLEHGKNGNPFETFGPVIGVSRATLYNWLDQYPEFLDAKKLAQDFALKWWFEAGKNNLIMPEGEKFNSSVYIFTMKAMFQLRDGSESQRQLDNPVGQLKESEQVQKLTKEIDELRTALDVRKLRLVK